jgi:hypothetical protein
MINRKIIIYRKETDKPVVLTDENINPENIEQEAKDIEKMLVDSEEGDVVILEFSKDYLILKPDAIDLIVIGKPEIKDVELMTDDYDDELNNLKPAKEEDIDEIDIVDDSDSVSDVQNNIERTESKGDENLETMNKAMNALKKINDERTNTVMEDDIKVFIDDDTVNKTDDDDTYTGIE